MQSIPNELTAEIFGHLLNDVPRREESSKMKGTLGSVNKHWNEVLYSTVKLWDKVFVHYCMDMSHIEHVCRRARPTERKCHLHISTETEAEFGADDLEGCYDVVTIAAWSAAVAYHLAPLIWKAESITVYTYNAHAVLSQLQDIHADHALALKNFTCYATIAGADHTNYLLPIQSNEIELLSVSGINPIGLAPAQLQHMKTLRMFSVTKPLNWEQTKTILRSSMMLVELEIVDIACNGEVGDDIIELPALRILSLDISEAGGMEIVELLSTPGLVSFTVRGEFDAPWERVTRHMRPTLRKIKQCGIGTGLYTNEIKEFLSELHSTEVLDIHRGYTHLLEHITQTNGVGHPTMNNLRRWVVASGLTYAQAHRLFDWPGAKVNGVYERSDEDEFTSEFVKWREDGMGGFGNLLNQSRGRIEYLDLSARTRTFYYWWQLSGLIETVINRNN
ncbi:hypothetical protein R3P38DRAFT_2810491 [Favolaschia claudopus]|uniref:F-box domain-containing protein n=1 Tax=Favolaschia claudopus TaxID=2862362 RepID=A0AAV9ZBQ5_9AGAR